MAGASLTVLVGIPASGKSTYATHHFAPTEILSLDFCHRSVSDDDPAVGPLPALHLFREWLELRCTSGRRTVIDKTNLTRLSRQTLRAVARRHHLRCHIVLLDTPLALAQERNSCRARPLPQETLSRCQSKLEIAKQSLPFEDFDSFTTITP